MRAAVIGSEVAVCCCRWQMKQPGGGKQETRARAATGPLNCSGSLPLYPTDLFPSHHTAKEERDRRSCAQNTRGGPL
jgi:hypothetical protein